MLFGKPAQLSNPEYWHNTQMRKGYLFTPEKWIYPNENVSGKMEKL